MRQRSWPRGPDSRAVTRRPARRGPRSVVAVLKFLVMRSEFVFCKCGLRGQRGTHEVPPLLPWDTVSVACTLPPGARVPPSSARSVPASAPCRPLSWGVGAGGPRARVPLPPSAPGGALCCLSLSTLVAALPRAGSGASHLLLVQGPRTSPHRDCSPLGSPSAAVLGWWAQGKGRFIFLLPWGSAFLFCYGLYKFRSWL